MTLYSWDGYVVQAEDCNEAAVELALRIARDETDPDITDEQIEMIERDLKELSPKESEFLFCTDCGERTLRVIENTEPDGCGEYKQVCTCDNECCQQIVYIVRNK